MPRLTVRKLTFSPRYPSSSLTWATGFAILLVLLQFLPDEQARALWYAREEVTAGEWWRLFTGNLVHTGWDHLALNVGALLIGIWIFHPARTPLAWALALAVCGVVANFGLWLASPDVAWCIGMSGPLHGLLVIGAIDWWRDGERLGPVVLAIWIGKIVWEQWQGPMPFSDTALESPVITDAHLWGAVGGAIYVAAEFLWSRRTAAAG